MSTNRFSGVAPFRILLASSTVQSCGKKQRSPEKRPKSLPLGFNETVGGVIGRAHVGVDRKPMLDGLGNKLFSLSDCVWHP